MDHRLPSTWLPLPSALDGPRAVAGLSWWQRWEGSSPLFPTGSVFYDASQYRQPPSPPRATAVSVSWRTMDDGGQSKREQFCMGGKTTTKQLLVTKNNSKYGIHTKHLGGKHLLCQILFTDKLRGRWEAVCSFSALKGKPGAPSLEEWWRGKRTCVDGWLQACKQCGQNCILLPKGKGTGSLLPWDGGKVRSWGRGLREKLWRADQSLLPSPRGQTSWRHRLMLLGGATFLPSQSWCPCKPLTPSAAAVGLAL